MIAIGRFCCKSLFAPVIKNFPGFRTEKLAPDNLGLLQQYRHFCDISSCGGMSAAGES
jgi:hypothetical protein